MSDRLKQYIQQHKHIIDNKVPPSDLFDRIMINEKAKLHINLPKKHSTKFNFHYLWIAASICILIVFIFSLNIEENGTDQTLSLVSGQSPLLQHQKEIFEDNIKVNEIIIANETKAISEKTMQIQSNKKVNKQSKTIKAKTIIQQEIIENTNNIELANQLTDNQMDQEIAILNEPIIKDTNIETEDTEPLIKTNEEPQHGNITQLSSSEPIVSVADHSNQSYTIGKAIFKGIMKLISKKSSEWTSDVLKIESKELNQKTFIAVNYKSETVAFHKSISIPIQ
ncbi:MAG: hypothetical protein IPO85_03375 [Saprospiraceae bacterium]|uniref:Uncharacterized protein n=1 Tax=Candidatus Defluviibacterium haderslevense TaxID=2981993 RepID=A0A9D7S7W8_9BACT|nr:hypothetical protein [Candidatus Defluviibacterium haderslevense]